MTPLERQVAAALGPDGALARARADTKNRPGQLDMAAAVARTIEKGDRLVVEAGTGIGKTFAYLFPLLLSGRRALLSTATQALQDQLFLRDIPAVVRALGLPVRVALLKGRSSYVCLQRLEQARHGAGAVFRDPAMAAALEHVQRWALQSVRGDLAELAGLHERSPLRPLISSTRENCLGMGCPRLTACHVNRARSESRAADWVVINHHLLLADQRLKEAGAPELLPAAEVVVVDEAHQLHDTAVQLMGQAIGTAELRDLARELAVVGPLRARGLGPWAHLALALEQAASAVSSLYRLDSSQAHRLRWIKDKPQGLDPAGWTRAVAAVAAALGTARQALALTADAAFELAQLHQQTHALTRDWQQLTRPVFTALAETAEAPGSAAARWLEWGTAAAGPRPWRLVGASVDVKSTLDKLLQTPAAGLRSWVFTSATLGTDETLSWFTRPLGLNTWPGVHTLRVPSPFDHEAQAALYVPDNLPEALQPAHTPALADAVARWAQRLGGRTLVLTTTLRAARVMAHELRRLVAQPGSTGLEILDASGSSSRALLVRFRAAGTDTDHPGVVLVASMSFWEGVDLAGDSLQLLVIDKLPFPPPDDPYVQARAMASEAMGQRPFEAIYLPDAAQALKQGAGRLIRTDTDCGVLVVADRRLLTRPYSPRLLQALPPMRRLLDEADMLRALDELVLTRLSTRDLSRS